ncbi:hypothetical protein C2E23DRAFT_77468 [Lenzites betulinus]|nr:hypothetical protein C2E23DRAFT_77468 [Lenzites betulinus]
MAVVEVVTQAHCALTSLEMEVGWRKGDGGGGEAEAEVLIALASDDFVCCCPRRRRHEPATCASLPARLVAPPPSSRPQPSGSRAQSSFLGVCPDSQGRGGSTWPWKKREVCAAQCSTQLARVSTVNRCPLNMLPIRGGGQSIRSSAPSSQILWRPCSTVQLHEHPEPSTRCSWPLLLVAVTHGRSITGFAKPAMRPHRNEHERRLASCRGMARLHLVEGSPQHVLMYSNSNGPESGLEGRRAACLETIRLLDNVPPRTLAGPIERLLLLARSHPRIGLETAVQLLSPVGRPRTTRLRSDELRYL